MLVKDGLASRLARVVAAYVSHNSVPTAELPSLITSTHSALKSLGKNPQEPVAEEKPVPVVPIKKSVCPDFLICLEDGKQFKSLKRHLRTAYNMTPEGYRAKWGLPDDYPMVAPAYAEARSQMAKRTGLGQLRRGAGKAARPVRGRTPANK